MELFTEVERFISASDYFNNFTFTDAIAELKKYAFKH